MDEGAVTLIVFRLWNTKNRRSSRKPQHLTPKLFKYLDVKYLSIYILVLEGLAEDAVQSQQWKAIISGSTDYVVAWNIYVILLSELFLSLLPLNDDMKITK